MDDIDKRKKQLVIVAAVLFVIVMVAMIVFAIVSSIKNKEGTVQISNLESCSKKIAKSVKRDINLALYSYVKSANDYNGKDTKSYYNSSIRDGSCKQEVHRDVEQEYYYTTTIVDIPDAKQSWRVEYLWVPEGMEILTDFGPINVFCLAEDELKYGSFNCEKLSIISDTKDDILWLHLPYSSNGAKGTEYSIDAILGDDLKVDHVDIATNACKSEELVKKYEASALEWIRSTGANPEDYDIRFRHLCGDGEAS